MDSITYSSELSPDYREELENLLFFNPDQARHRPAILSAIEHHGLPKIVTEKNQLRLRLDGGPEVQTVFAWNTQTPGPVLVGAAIYTRIEPETFQVLHVAVAPDYSAQGPCADQMLTLQLLGKLRDIARRVKGVRSLRLYYGQDNTQEIPV